MILGLAAGAVVAIASADAGAVGLIGIVVVAGAALLAGWGAEPTWVEEPIPDPGPPGLFDMVALGGGTFWMGSPRDEPGRHGNERRHRVTVSDFKIGATTVTRKQYREVTEGEEAPGPGGLDHPVTEVSWIEAVEFCNRASESAGFEPCYRIDGEHVTWIREANGYRLPTEAEWEYAARAGTQTRWSFGDDEERLGEHAWFGGNSGFTAHAVAKLAPNPWELYDMHGNVWEWCWDAYADFPRIVTFLPRRNPFVDKVTATSALRVLRGGSFWGEPRFLRSAFRFRFPSEDRGGYLGFRCVRRSHPQPRLLTFGLFARSAKSTK